MKHRYHLPRQILCSLNCHRRPWHIRLCHACNQGCDAIHA
ncbi:hypothetical protein DRO37_04790 [Candidatus Bathyarchaeota archaeon]|nr:MAG: hypothetical protein DRO37_04790 [Candidatus Bathyarchaeota archaeon]